jgi:hypothetical protein
VALEERKLDRELSKLRLSQAEKNVKEKRKNQEVVKILPVLSTVPGVSGPPGQHVQQHAGLTVKEQDEGVLQLLPRKGDRNVVGIEKKQMNAINLCAKVIDIL